MPNTTHLHFLIDIQAPVARVWDMMLNQEPYRNWTSAFMQGSYYEGSWLQGQRIRFLAPSGDGIFARIAQNKRHEFLSIEHLGTIKNGKEDTESAAARAWTPMFENYTFRTTPRGTELRVDQEMTTEYAAALRAMWPHALIRLKGLAEAKA